MSIYDTKEYRDSIRQTVIYEWWLEQWDHYDDIQDCEHIDIKQWPVNPVEGCTPRLVLKRYAGSDAEGVKDIGHAYVVGRALEPEFDSGHKVPKRYMDQLARL